MRSLARAFRHAPDAGTAIPCQLRCVQDLGLRMLRGQLSLWVAAPGGGKTLLALQVALQSDVPTLYVSADTDRNDQSVRAALALGWDGADPDGQRDALALIRRDVAFSFESAPTAHDIAQECEAYAIVWGRFPELIIVDTLAKVWSDGDETARAKDGVDKCQEIARVTGAHVMLLHHLQKSYDRGDIPPSLDGIMSGVSKIPEQVIGMWRDNEDRLGLNVLKNRSGRADPAGNRVRSFVQVDFGSMRLVDIVVPTFDWSDDEKLMGGVYD